MATTRKFQKAFDRWIPNEKSSWIFQVFQKYNSELEKNLWSYYPASKYLYKKLGENSAEWTDNVNKHFYFTQKKEELYINLQDWSDSYKNFDNWVNLNTIMSISANFETYIASIISLALKSNPGIILGATKMIDGVSILKNGTPTKLNFDDQITLCTKGDWNSRINAFDKIFGEVPEILKTKVSSLERIRKLRNNVGHAFGRDISTARDHAIKKTIPTETISRDKTLEYQKLLWSIAKSLDIFLVENHIGTFQALNFYNSILPNMPKNMHPNNRASILKNKVGRTGVQPVSKQFYKDLITYYDSL